MPPELELLEPPELLELLELPEPASWTTPPSGRSVPPQMPVAEPGAWMQGMPLQQSAVFVQVLPTGWQAPTPRHCPPMHGFPQQSALVAQTDPTGGAPAAQSTAFRRQRGIPSASFLQHFASGVLQKLEPVEPMGSQQLFSAEHESLVPGLQMLPGSRHALPLSQRPNSSVGDFFAQSTSLPSGFHPQQSLPARQSSPVGWQPEGGWHTRKPLVAPK